MTNLFRRLTIKGVNRGKLNLWGKPVLSKFEERVKTIVILVNAIVGVVFELTALWIIFSNSHYDLLPFLVLGGICIVVPPFVLHYADEFLEGINVTGPYAEEIFRIFLYILFSVYAATMVFAYFDFLYYSY